MDNLTKLNYHGNKYSTVTVFVTRVAERGIAMTIHCEEPTETTEDERTKAELEKAQRRAEAIAFNAQQREQRLLASLDRVVPPKFH